MILWFVEVLDANLKLSVSSHLQLKKDLSSDPKGNYTRSCVTLMSEIPDESFRSKVKFFLQGSVL